MLARIANSSIECREEMVVAKLRAARAASPELRLEHERLAYKWKQLADTFDLVVQVSGFLEWSSQRLRD